VRVIAGSARGIRLDVPRSTSIRPTTDANKAAIFSMLSPLAPFPKVLDLYAGTGGLGIEALSRWGGEATFVESERAAVQSLRRNLDRTRLRDQTVIDQGSLPRALDRLNGAFDLVLLDPPYDDPDIATVMIVLGERAMVASNGIAVLEHTSRFQPSAEYGTLRLWKSRRHGDTILTLYDHGSGGIQNHEE